MGVVKILEERLKFSDEFDCLAVQERIDAIEVACNLIGHYMIVSFNGDRSYVSLTIDGASTYKRVARVDFSKKMGEVVEMNIFSTNTLLYVGFDEQEVLKALDELLGAL